MQITATELKTNIGKYLVLAERQDIFITKNNKPIAKLTSVQEDKLVILDSLVGIIPNNGYTLDDARCERLAKQ
jgi:prevent-host-death family protein